MSEWNNDLSAMPVGVDVLVYVPNNKARKDADMILPISI